MVSMDVSASIDDVAAMRLVSDISHLIAVVSDVSPEAVQITLRVGQLVMWGGRLGGKDGAPHAAQLRLAHAHALATSEKEGIVSGICQLLEPHSVAPAAAQFLFETLGKENLVVGSATQSNFRFRESSSGPTAEPERNASTEPPSRRKRWPECRKQPSDQRADEDALQPTSAPFNAEDAASFRWPSSWSEHVTHADSIATTPRGVSLQQKISAVGKMLSNAKLLRTAITDEGIATGLEIDRASEAHKLDFVCTTVELPEGVVEHLELSMAAMNADAGQEPAGAPRGGCSGRVGKMIFSVGQEQLAMVAYVPDADCNQSAGQVNIAEWMDQVCEAVHGVVTKAAALADSPHGGLIASAKVTSDPTHGKDAHKDRDLAIEVAVAYLHSKGALPRGASVESVTVLSAVAPDPELPDDSLVSSSIHEASTRTPHTAVRGDATVRDAG
jgi:hypothetical protein